jgi:hypothetical protein
MNHKILFQLLKQSIHWYNCSSHLQKGLLDKMIRLICYRILNITPVWTHIPVRTSMLNLHIPVRTVQVVLWFWLDRYMRLFGQVYEIGQIDNHVWIYKYEKCGLHSKAKKRKPQYVHIFNTQARTVLLVFKIE